MRKFTFLLFATFIISFTLKAQVVLVSENFQNWTAQGTSGAYTVTKKLADGTTDGTFSSDKLIVAPSQSIGAAGTASGNGSPTIGRVVVGSTAGYFELPTLPTIGQIQIKANIGTDSRTMKLQIKNGSVFEDIPNTLTTVSKDVIKLFTYNFSYSTPTTIRIVTSNSSLNIWDLVVSSYVSNLPALPNAPITSAATSIGSENFIANWSTVTNATGYILKVYQGENLIITNIISNVETTSFSVGGLTPNTNYTYTLTAKGDGINNSNSAESTSVAVTTSNYPSTIYTDFNDGSWGTPSATNFSTGSFPSSTFNGFILNSSGLITGTTKDNKGKNHTNRISIDKLSYSGKVILPAVSSIGQIEIHGAAGTVGNGITLKEYNSNTLSWDVIGTYIYEQAQKDAGVDSVYIIPISRNNPTKLSIENASGGGYYLYQIITRTTNPILLDKPITNSATNISGAGFNANWTAVANATGYKVFVYQGVTLISGAPFSVADQVSLAISGLNPETSYTYKVQAIGDNDLTFSDSFLSSTASVTTTNTFNITTTKSISGLTSINSSSIIDIANGATLNIDVAKSVGSIILNAGAKMNVASGNPLTVSTLTLKSDKDDNTFSAKLDANITATNVRLFKTIDDTKWYFMSFPTDVEINAITKSNGDAMTGLGTDWVIKYYDGNKRANDGVSNGSNWVSVTSGTLTANKGYIFGLKTGIPETELLIPLNLSILSAESEKTVSVFSYSTGVAAAVHKGWNLVGQPYLSKYDAQTGSDASYMVIPNANGKTYTVKSRAVGNLPMINPISAYFVQSGVDGNLSFGLTGRQNTRSLIEKNETEYLQLIISTPTGTDETYLILDDNQSTAYQIGQDMEKWIGTGTDKPQIYTTTDGVNYAFNSLPMNNVNKLPVGIYSKTSGATTISVNALKTSGISKIILKDNTTGINTDLLTSNYNYTSQSGTETNRFGLTIQRISTENDLKNDLNGPNIKIKNGLVELNNLSEKSAIKVYDAVGHVLIAKDLESSKFEILLNVRGLYTIKIVTGNKTWTKKIIF